MTLLGLLEAEDQRSQFRQAQPVRHHPAQHAALVAEQSRRRRPLAGYHQGDAAAAPLLAIGVMTYLRRLGTVNTGVEGRIVVK